MAKKAQASPEDIQERGVLALEKIGTSLDDLRKELSAIGGLLREDYGKAAKRFESDKVPPVDNEEPEAQAPTTRGKPSKAAPKADKAAPVQEKVPVADPEPDPEDALDDDVIELKFDADDKYLQRLSQIGSQISNNMKPNQNLATADVDLSPPFIMYIDVVADADTNRIALRLAAAELSSTKPDADYKEVGVIGVYTEVDEHIDFTYADTKYRLLIPG